MWRFGDNVAGHLLVGVQTPESPSWSAARRGLPSQCLVVPGRVPECLRLVHLLQKDIPVVEVRAKEMLSPAWIKKQGPELSLHCTGHAKLRWSLWVWVACVEGCGQTPVHFC